MTKNKTEQFFSIPGSCCPLQGVCALKKLSRFQAAWGPKQAKNAKKIKTLAVLEAVWGETPHGFACIFGYENQKPSTMAAASKEPHT